MAFFSGKKGDQKSTYFLEPSRTPFFPVSAPKTVPKSLIFGSENGSQREVAYFWPTCRIYRKTHAFLMICQVRKPHKSTKIRTNSTSERASAKKRLRKLIFHDFWCNLGSPGALEIGQGAPKTATKSLQTLPSKIICQLFSGFLR